VVQGGHATQVDAPRADELDPTGAGDTFCGAVLAGLVRGEHPIIVAQKACVLASQMIESIGGTMLWSKMQLNKRYDSRVMANHNQITRVAKLISRLPDVQPFNFIGSGLPSTGHPQALDFFFAATLQQFGFWYISGGCYGGPLLAPVASGVRKGSDYLWHSYLERLKYDLTFLSPERQLRLTQKEMLIMFRSDDGRDMMPAVDLRLEQAHAYGRDMLALGLSPEEIVSRANSSKTPLLSLIQILDHIGGYKEDPFRKKSSLLALILSERPEKFLQLNGSEQIQPIIDYHLMRSCLRIGLVDVLDPNLRQALVERRLLQPADEWAVRQASFEAIGSLTALSGKSMAAVDRFFFNARRWCPEMSETECRECSVDPVCSHQTDLFQPVLRTVFY
jgi:hypothetical protein